MLPKLFGFPWEKQDEEPHAQPTPKSTRPQKSSAPEEQVLVMRPRGRDPVWLKPYRERLAQASRIAAERTRHLTGPERVRAMNAIVRELIKGP